MRNLYSATLVTLGSLLACSAVQAQDSLAGVGMATSAGASIDAASASSLSAGRVTQRLNGGANHNVGQTSHDLMNETDRAGDLAANAPEFPNASTGASPSAGAPAISGSAAADWGMSGQQELDELTSTPTESIASGAGGGNTRAARRARYLRARARVRSRRRRHRRGKAEVQMTSYQPPATYWLFHYLPEDQYKIEAGDWKFVSEETDRYYYAPNAPGILAQDADHVIGFHTWQDAMIAGYRPDPRTKPTPGAQFAYLASMDPDGTMLTTFVQVAYGGQMTPQNFDATYAYLTHVIGVMNRYPYVSDLRGGVIEKVFQASLTNNPSVIPASIGGDLASWGTPPTANPNGVAATGAARGPSNGPAPVEMDGTLDKREGEFNSFSNHAGSLANVPANNK